MQCSADSALFGSRTSFEAASEVAAAMGIQDDDGVPVDDKARAAACVCVIDSGAGIGSTPSSMARRYMVLGTRERNETVVTTAMGSNKPEFKCTMRYPVELDPNRSWWGRASRDNSRYITCPNTLINDACPGTTNQAVPSASSTRCGC